jgi:fluoroacetyl-CoA thioesterase
MHQIPLGAKGTFTLRVLTEHLANQFRDAMLPEVLATPVMILIMENAALNAIRPFLDSGESAVGTSYRRYALRSCGSCRSRGDQDRWETN